MGTISKEEWKRMHEGRKKNKYSARKCEYAGHTFASQLERDLFIQLKTMEESEEIGMIQVQAKVILTDAKILYLADFKAKDTSLNEDVWFEAKGVETDVWRLKRRLWLSYGPGKLRVYKRWGKNHLQLHEEIVPIQKTQFCTCQAPTR